MTLCPLPSGLSPDAVEKLRWEAFGHKRDYAFKSVDDLSRFAQKRGFVLIRPRAGLHFPSLLEGGLGRPLLDFVWDEKARQVETWRHAALKSGKVVTSVLLDGLPTLISKTALVDFCVLSPLKGDLKDHERLYKSGGLSRDATRLCQGLLKAGPCTAETLRELLSMQSPAGQRRMGRALNEALVKLLILEVGYETPAAPPAVKVPRGKKRGKSAVSAPATPNTPPKDRAVYDLLARVCSAQCTKASDISVDSARRRIASRYLRNVILESAHEMSRVLGWEMADTVATCDALVRRHVASLHPASRHNQPRYQAGATDLFDELPAL